MLLRRKNATFGRLPWVGDGGNLIALPAPWYDRLDRILRLGDDQAV